MSKPFKVGETAKLVNCDHFPEYNDTECVIHKGLDECIYSNATTVEKELGLRYIVLACDGRYLAARPDQLKPKVGTPDAELKKEATL